MHIENDDTAVCSRRSTGLLRKLVSDFQGLIHPSAAMSSITARRMSLCYALIVNAGTRRLALASPGRRLASPPATFVRSFTPTTTSLKRRPRPYPDAHSSSRKLERSLWLQRQSCLCSSRHSSPALRPFISSRHKLPKMRSMHASFTDSLETVNDATTTRFPSTTDAAVDGAGASVKAAEGRLKVTLLSGFLGAGKTTLMRNVLRQAREECLSLAVIVNDMADVNIDAQILAAREGAGESVGSVDAGASVAMQGGCICCTLRDELLLEVETIARAGKHQHLIIEATGISDPAPVTEAFLMIQGNSSDSGDGDARERQGGGGREGAEEGSFSLDTLVTVVDSTSFLDEVRKADDLEERGLEAQEGDTRTIADLLVSQVEFSNVILLNKADLVAEEGMATLEEVVRQLNPAARVLRSISSDVALAEVVGTGAFHLDEAGLLQEMNVDDAEKAAIFSHGAGSSSSSSGGVEHDSVDTAHRHREMETFGVRTFTFRARRPFHPQRLMAFVMEHLPSVLRSKGFVWLATRHDKVGVWNHAGGSFATEYGGSWDDDGTSTLDLEHDHLYDRQEGVASLGARYNEIVFIGLGMNESVLTTELRRCLLTDEEVSAGSNTWSAIPDPFPPWEDVGED